MASVSIKVSVGVEITGYGCRMQEEDVHNHSQAHTPYNCDAAAAVLTLTSPTLCTADDTGMLPHTACFNTSLST